LLFFWSLRDIVITAYSIAVAEDNMINNTKKNKGYHVAAITFAGIASMPRFTDLTNTNLVL
jgi:hypothetical protein